MTETNEPITPDAVERDIALRKVIAMKARLEEAKREHEKYTNAWYAHRTQLEDKVRKLEAEVDRLRPNCARCGAVIVNGRGDIGDHAYCHPVDRTGRSCYTEQNLENAMESLRGVNWRRVLSDWWR